LQNYKQQQYPFNQPIVMGWVVNTTKMLRPGYSVRFLGVVWLGKTLVIPNAVIDKIRAFPTAQDKLQLQVLLGLLGN
jgi:hypothetical protein